MLLQSTRLRPSRVFIGPRHVALSQCPHTRPLSGLSSLRTTDRRQDGPLTPRRRPICGQGPRIGVLVRGKRTKTVVNLDDLPQGVIRADTLPPLEPEPPAAPSYPTVVLQARRNMQQFDNCVLLTRVGGFYELYFEQADEYGPLLNLKVAQKKTAAGPVSMVILT